MGAHDDTIYETMVVAHRVVLNTTYSCLECFPILEGFKERTEVKKDYISS